MKRKYLKYLAVLSEHKISLVRFSSKNLFVCRFVAIKNDGTPMMSQWRLLVLKFTANFTRFFGVPASFCNKVLMIFVGSFF